MSPALPLLGAVAVGALLLALKGKSSKTPEPIDIPAIYMKGAAGTRQFELRHVGPGYSWTVSGSKEGGGSDTNSGHAIMSMFEFLYEGNSADIVTGHIAKGSEPGIAGSFSIVRESQMKWSWIINDSANTSFGSGDSTSRGAATIAMLRAVEPFTDWIVNIPAPVGEGQGDPFDSDNTPLDPSTGDAPFDPTLATHGLLITDTAVTVVHLDTWLEWAAPIIVDGIQVNKTATEIHNDLGLGLDTLPNTIKFNGRSHGQVVNEMLAYLNQWDQGKFLELDSIQDTVAASAVGVKLKTIGKKGRVKDKPVIARRRASDGRYEWFVWAAGGNRRGDQFAIFTGDARQESGAWTEAVNAASGPGTVSGGGPPIGECDDVRTGGDSKNLTAAVFDDHQERKIKVWSPADASCHSYRLEFGICLRPSGGGTFGGLDQYTANLSEGQSPSDGVANKTHYGIDRHPAYNYAMDWHLFRTPLAWKRQFVIRLSYVDGQLEILNINQDSVDAVDPCPDVSRRWPGLGDDHYVVDVWGTGIHKHELSKKNWTSQPKMTLTTEGKNLYLNISYSGLPFFKADSIQHYDEGDLYWIYGVDQSKKTSYTVAYKFRSSGQEG